MRASFPVLVALLTFPLLAQNAAVTINVDATAKRLPIDPRIYGLAFASTAQLSDLNVPLNRSGGNSTTRYNWQANANNHAADWFFESIGENSAVAGEMADTFIAGSKAGGAQAMITVPMIGWVAKLGVNRAKTASFSVAKYGAQQYTDYWMPDAGNGTRANGQEIAGNDPNDANLAVDSSFQAAWFQHLVSKWGPAASGGLRYYLLDNEASIWQSTHRDVHPVGATMDEIRTKMLDYADRVKTADPGAIVLGPEEWGWSGYFYSGYDQQYGAAHGWSSYPDRIAHGNRDYTPWLLDQFRQSEAATGRRLLDVFTLHFYPQSGEFGNDTSAAMQLKRNRSTRSLWDPAYVDESWIGDKVSLIPRMRGWVDSYYPDTKIGITEYNWGAEGHINGATAQADIFGIFGREGLDIATRWTTPDSGTPVYNAIRIYRNYDGQKSAFGDISVSASGPNPDNVSTFASVRSSDRALTLVIINKTLSGTTPATVVVSNYAVTGTVAHRWELTAANTIAHPADVPVNGGTTTLTLPAQSITMLVFPGTTDVIAPTVTLSSSDVQSSGKLSFTGTASDDVGVTRVTYALTGATTGSGQFSGTSSWSGQIAFQSGLTRVGVTAWDAAGNQSKLTTFVVQSAWVTGTEPVKRRGARH